MWLLASALSYSASGGKDFFGMMIFFPFMMLLGLYFPDSLWLIPLLLFQFPLYAVAVGAAWRGKCFISRLACVALLHALAVTTCFAIQARIENRTLKSILNAQEGRCETIVCQ